jgi:hypothetical protein
MADRDWEVADARQASGAPGLVVQRSWPRMARRSDRSSVDWDITAPPYGGAVLPECDGDKPGPQQPDDLLPSMTVAFIALVETDAVVNR